MHCYKFGQFNNINLMYINSHDFPWFKEEPSENVGNLEQIPIVS